MLFIGREDQESMRPEFEFLKNNHDKDDFDLRMSFFSPPEKSNMISNRRSGQQNPTKQIPLYTVYY